jgi:hypothetical protein
MARRLLNSAADTTRRINMPSTCGFQEVTWKNDLISGSASFMITVRFLPRLDVIKTD